MNIIDLQECLKSWPYEAEQNVRIERGADGRKVLLVRLPMGLEQYEVDGHPDSGRAHGMATALDLYQARICDARRTSSAPLFELTSEDCIELLREAKAYNHRLIVLLRLKDWTRAQRDATHILRLLEFVSRYAPCAEDGMQLDPWWSHVARINAIANIRLLLDKRQYQDAFQTARNIGIPENADESGPENGRFVEALLETVTGSRMNHPILHLSEECFFVRQNDYWAIRYHGHSALLKSARGLNYLSCLLREPGREFHVSELLSSLLEAPAAASGIRANARLCDDRGLHITFGLDAGSPIMDARAKAECKTRLNELRQELEEAEQFNAPERAAKARDDMDAIAQHLASTFGLGGRDRKTSCEAERARCAVTKSIKRAIREIGDSIPSLGNHLAATIKTGYFCSYNAHPDRSVAWKF